MSRIDEKIPFIPVNIAVLTVSDTRTTKEDKSGATLERMLTQAGHTLAERTIVTDDVPLIQNQVKGWIDNPDVDVVITTGGTGFTGRDVTPEAMTAVVREGDRRVLGHLPHAELRKGRHIDHPVAGLRRCRGRYLHLLCARLTRRLQGCLGGHSQIPAR